MRYLNLLIKPASEKCNMNCSYCFYADSGSRTINKKSMMSIDTIEAIIKKAIDLTQERLTIGFQGGEPTLAGLGFFEKVIEFEKKYNNRKIAIENTIQTNGLLIDDDWSRFFKKNNILIGISIDGIKTTHDYYRTDIKGSGTHERVMKSLNCLKKYNVDFNVLCVITNQLVDKIDVIFKFFKDNQLNYLQFIPCLDDDRQLENGIPKLLTVEKYTKFLKKTFDLWYKDFMSDQYISIRHIDNLIMIIMGDQPENCAMNGLCTCYGCIEADGSVYPCDFYVVDQWKLGNIIEDNLQNLLQGENAKRFIKYSKKTNECSQCKYFWICRGGCRRHKKIEGMYELGKNIYCDSYKEFFDYALTRLFETKRYIK